MRSGICFMLVIVVVLGIATGCSDDGVPNQPGGELGTEVKLAPISAVSNKINIVVDPRVELMAVVQFLSDYRTRMTTLHFPYGPTVRHYFEDFKEHEAVQMFEQMGPTGFSDHIPPTFALSLTEDLEWDENVVLHPDVLASGGGEENLREFAAALKDFSAVSNFPDFFTSYQDFYAHSVQEVVSKIGDHDYISEIQTYFGKEYNSFTILPVILYRNDAYYAVQISRDDKIDLYNVIPPIRKAGIAQMSYVDQDIFRRWQRHDLSLSYVTRISESFAAEIAEFERLYIPLKDETERMNSRTWQSFVNEHIARAVTTRLAYADSDEVGDRAVAEELRQGFVYIEPILEKLVEYENSRDIYPDMAVFFPELLKAFEGIELPGE